MTNILKLNRLFIALSLVPWVMASAQENADTNSLHRDLEEVSVEAPRVVRKIDRDLYFPTASARKMSANGMQLVDKFRKWKTIHLGSDVDPERALYRFWQADWRRSRTSSKPSEPS